LPTTCFTQSPREEAGGLSQLADKVKPGQGDDLYRHNGAGEIARLQCRRLRGFPRRARPDLSASMENGSRARREIARRASLGRWRLHATYDETISRALDVFEKVKPRRAPRRTALVLRSLRDDLGPQHRPRGRTRGGIAIQHRMAFQGEYFVERYGRDRRGTHAAYSADAERPAIPVGAGTDATRCGFVQPMGFTLVARHRKQP